MLERPWVLGDDTVEYAFSKTWTDPEDGETTWLSRDVEADRDKVERLVFVKGALKTAEVVSLGNWDDVAEDDLGTLLRVPQDEPWAEEDEFQAPKKPMALGIPDPKLVPDKKAEEEMVRTAKKKPVKRKK